MPQYKCEDIVLLPNRQRLEFDPGAMLELEESIAKHGLFHPIVVRKLADGRIALVAGERRLRAVRALHAAGAKLTYDGWPFDVGSIPCADLGDLDPVAAEEAELEENIRRSDLTWQEVARARARLHELRKSQNPAQTLVATAQEIFGGNDTSPVTQALVLAAHMDDPEVRKAASAKEAMRIVERKVRSAENVERAKEVAKIESPHVLVIADCLTPTDIPPIDVLLTDPPYGMGADEFGDSGGAAVQDHAYKDDEVFFLGTVIPALVKYGKACRANAHAYVFCDLENFFRLRTLFEESLDGWKPFRTPLIWKRNTGRVPIPDYGPRRQYELILFARKGDRKVNYIAPDVLEFPTAEDKEMSAQKPVALFEELIKRSARPGDWIADPFCGTGTIFPAAHAQRCRAWGCEMNPATAGIAAKRLQQLTGNTGDE